MGPEGEAGGDCKVKDVNKDGMPDLVCKFRFSAGHAEDPRDPEGRADGDNNLWDYDFHGSDTIRFVN